MSNKTESHIVPGIMIAAAVALLNIATPALAGGDSASDMSEAAIAARIAPVGKLNTGAAFIVSAPVVAAPAAAPKAASTASAAAPAKAARTGEQIYSSTCMVCHAAGIAGAPKLGDSAAWAPRIATGADALLASAIKGKGAMPPMGTCATCSADEFKSAVDYMISKSQ
ncbi:MAG: cytochrome c5 family protein [Gammaproteobacteria bacterium]|nr:cytochrome c5 family protein [Gammaproteobacteria bacterium]